MRIKFEVYGIEIQSKSKIINKSYRKRFKGTTIEIYIPPVEGGDMALTKLRCGEEINEGDAVVLYNGLIYKGNPYDENRILFVGIAKEHGVVNSEIDIIVSGEFVVPYNFSSSGVLYLREDGGCSLFPPTPPVNGGKYFIIEIGYGVGNKIVIDHKSTFGVK